ncbi:hypothetical protein CcCBS67573_g07305 [Chytriomyces confervae]|uniref:type I protein arginine methyltransferase n=1 Tax=Chytriomyces confervae TaxID=246404 RepID=A0A507EV97_9FUNG|nr:hypothetical protein CcCBS67573_g07305 [Chytriomyces confervae]
MSRIGMSQTISTSLSHGRILNHETNTSYYAQFVHQQNMLQDHVRTSLYQNAIVANGDAMFKDRLVMDVGAGSGILSYFAVQSGAAKVYAIEASGMATKIQKMVSAASANPPKNAFLKDKLVVVHSKVEEAQALPRVDTIVSEPIGVLLLHERMVESFIFARDAFLKPGGNMMPNSGTIFLAPFTDAVLWTQTMAKVRFWEQTEFFGVDFSPLKRDAMDEVFGQPIVGNFDHRVLMASSVSHHVDFLTCSMDDLKDIVIPIMWTPSFTGIVHGVAGWFDIDLCGIILSTAPNAERTHWQQVRFVLKEPLAVNAFETVKGWFRMTVNSQRSYDVVVELNVGDAPLTNPHSGAWVNGSSMDCGEDELSDMRTRRGKWALQEQTYWYTNDALGPEYSKPEFMSMYPSPFAESSMLPDVPPVAMGNATNI